ncbi:MAG: hypothetical protein AB7V62_01750 [Thermoleophilia bacterium]
MGERDDTMRRWRTGEERLYPVATVRPDLYQAVVGIVRALADHLGRVPDIDALVTTFRASDRDAELAAAGVDVAGLPPEIDRDLVRDAAYQVRVRELQVRASVERAETTIRRARAAGERVAVVWAEGEREEWPPWRRVEMSVATGRAVALSAELDPDTMTARWAVEGLALDPETGAALEGEPLAPRREFTEPESWRAAADALRHELLST